MNIVVNVETKHLAEQTDPKNDRFVFAYTINIANQDAAEVQLINRYWLITDANGKKTEVQGPGVVGEQPVITAGDDYTYTSGCILETEVGTMEGYYEMKAADGEMIKVQIPVFRLALPNILH